MNVKPVVFLYGTDSFQKRLFIEEIRFKLFPNGSTGLNDDLFDAGEGDLSELFDLANTLPMLATTRLIVVKNARTPKDKEQERWLHYIDKPSPDTTIIVDAEKIDKRLKFFKELTKKKALVECAPPKPRELGGWLLKLSKRHEIELAPQAAQGLAESIGPDLGRLDQELEKLSLFVNPRKRIEAKDVEQLVLKTAGENVFAWSDQIVAGNINGALSILGHLLESGEPPLILVAMLARHLRILMKTTHHMRARTPQRQLAPLLGIPPFLVGRYVDQARRLDDSHLRHSFSELQKLDRELKSTGHPPRMLLERSVRTITRHCSQS